MKKPRKKLQWAADAKVQKDGTVHVYPCVDWIQHKLEGVDCQCQPKIELFEFGTLVVHNRCV